MLWLGAFCATLMILAATPATKAEDANSANYSLPGCKAWLADTPSGFLGGVCVGSIETTGFMAQNSDLAITALSGTGQFLIFEQIPQDSPCGVVEAMVAQRDGTRELLIATGVDEAKRVSVAVRDSH